MSPNLQDYDRIIIANSGGKDSLASVLHVLDNGIPPSRIELWHHRVDGLPEDIQGDAPQFGLFDWPCTDAYNEALGKALNIPVFMSWRHGGITREMFRKDALTAPVSFERDDLTIGTAGGVRGKKNTRRKYPQVSANLQTRWCSACVKIDVADVALNNQERFQHGKTLFITGERAEESSARAKYKTFEPHRADRRDGKRVKRYIDHWRPVHDWPEAKVWEIIERHRILVHPAYRLGWGRLSCMACIFGSPSQWASIKEIDPERFNTHVRIEQEFGCTIHRTKSLVERVQDAKPYVDMPPLLVVQALTYGYSMPIFTDNWKLPAGAFGENAGPS
jgi:hypothetical protein